MRCPAGQETRTNWVYATGAGVLLGLLFLRHGIEAPIVARFLADLFSWGPVVMGCV
ncbi:MAG: hypothetical protein AB1503_00035 [Bacillota bacterium]|nr:hypothetical protein [Bacillota bacterium]